MKLCERLIQVRHWHGLSLREVEGRSNGLLPFATLWRMEQGGNVTIDSLGAVARAYDLSLSELLEGVDER